MSKVLCDAHVFFLHGKGVKRGAKKLSHSKRITLPGIPLTRTIWVINHKSGVCHALTHVFLGAQNTHIPPANGQHKQRRNDENSDRIHHPYASAAQATLMGRGSEYLTGIVGILYS